MIPINITDLNSHYFYLTILIYKSSLSILIIIIIQVAESGCHLVSIKPFAANDYVGYKPLGHRGHGGSFLIDGSESFSIQKSLKQSALQAPLYIHEVHVLAVGIVLDVDLFQAKTRYIVMELCSDINKSHALWTVNLVDIYMY